MNGIDDDLDDGFVDYFDPPGGDDFDDVTDLFTAASRDLELEEVVLMDGFTLMDAMSVFEIGEPRLDSGMLLEENRRPPFDPLTPLLPEEICWILDRTFACEMEWHSGKTLSQSVFTILFVHHLPDINPEYLPLEDDEDPERPQELITVVLRAGMLGLLKCCDMAWRELSKNRVHDIEDWQGEKCDVSLLEGINTNLVVHMLDAACGWLRQSDLPEAQTAALCDRLLLRKTFLQLYKLELLAGVAEISYHVAVARGLVHRVRESQCEDLPADSPVRLAMDPHIARRLPNYMPMRVTELPPVAQLWDTLEGYIEYWNETGRLIRSMSLQQWQAAGVIGIALNKSTPASYHRSVVQTLFFDSGLVFGMHRMTWLVEQFFYETIGLSYSDILSAFERSAPPTQMVSLQEVIERRIHKLMVPHIRSSWFNPPRRRRHLMKEVLQWHMLYDVMLNDVAAHAPPDARSVAILRAVPLAAKLWRLNTCREAILSGFQQELYGAEERPIAYWRLSCVLDVHLGCIEDLLPVIPSETSAHRELEYQSQHLAALQMISSTLVTLTAGLITSSLSVLSVQYRRRYKWLLNEEFDRLAPLDPPSSLAGFPAALQESLNDTLFSPSQTLQLAQNILLGLAAEHHDWVGPWAGDRCTYLRNLAGVCDRLRREVPETVRELPNFDPKRLKWDTSVHPWFPTV